MWKLVRDKIPEFSEEKKDDRRFSTVKDKAYIKCLRLKLLEEAEEVLESQTREELIEELADVQEVLDQLMLEENVLREEVRKVQVAKSFKKGGFKEGIILDMGS